MRLVGASTKLAGKAITLALALLMTAPNAFAQDAWSYSVYDVNFQPSQTRRIGIYDEQGRFLGHLGAETKITVRVPGDIIRDSLVNNAPDVPRVMQQLAYVDLNNRYALAMQFAADARTQEGVIVKANQRIFVDLNDFLNVAGAAPANTGTFQAATQPQAALDTEEHEDDGDDAAYDPTLANDNSELGRLRGRPFPPQFLSSPLCGNRGMRISSMYGMRARPKRGASRNHLGIDLTAPNGTPVRAAADGCVKDFGNFGKGGNTVILNHGNGYATKYMHLSGFVRGIRDNGCFKRGETIAYVGSTGVSTGNHLHFSVVKDGVNINPLNSFAVSARSVTALGKTCTETQKFAAIDQRMREALYGGRSTQVAARAGSRARSSN